MQIQFIPLAESHLPLLWKWLEAPHVKAWWDQDVTYTLDLVQQKFGKHLHGMPMSSTSNKLTYAYIVYIDENPIGYIQAYNALCFSEENGLDAVLIPASSAGIDMFIGEQECVGKGFGAKILKSFCNEILSPYFNYCLVDPDSQNHRAIHTYKKAGFKIINKLSNITITWMIRENIKVSSVPIVVSNKTVPHFLWGGNCDGWWLKKNGHFTVISEMMPRGTAEMKHFHTKAEQFFYVLEGVLDIDLNGINHRLQQHEGIAIMPQAIHKVCNKSDQDVKFLVVSCPDSHEDRTDVEE